MLKTKNTQVLHIDSSLLGETSATIKLTSEIVKRLSANNDSVTDVKHLSLGDGVPLIDGAIAGAALTPPDQRSAEQVESLAYGQAMIDDLKNADALVIGLPMYNFGPPAGLKAWADLVARVGVTFQYDETGQIHGLVEDKPTYIAVATGGVPIESSMDWATGWLKQFLNFVGITTVHVVSAEGIASNPDEAMATAMAGIDKLLPVVQTS